MFKRNAVDLFVSWILALRASSSRIAQWFSTGLASEPTITLNDKPKSRKDFNFSNLLNEKIVQFELEIVE